MKAAEKLILHVLAMADDAYLTGHPEWQEIVKDAHEAKDYFLECGEDCDGPERDDLDEDGPRAWHRIDAYTNPDGSIRATESTNDNLDHGYPSEFAEWERFFRNRAQFDSQAGRSRVGCSGIEVTVILDGERI